MPPRVLLITDQQLSEYIKRVDNDRDRDPLATKHCPIVLALDGSSGSW